MSTTKILLLAIVIEFRDLLRNISESLGELRAKAYRNEGEE